MDHERKEQGLKEGQDDDIKNTRDDVFLGARRAETPCQRKGEGSFLRGVGGTFMRARD